MALKKWTKEEEDLLKEFYPVTKLENMVNYIPKRSTGAIRTMATNLKVTKAVGFGKTKKWTDEDFVFLKKNYSNTENYILMEYFNCSEKSLYSAASKIGLKKTAEHISKVCGRVLKEVGKDTRFSKGHISFNTGKKQEEYMSEDAIERTTKTRFKKGQKPHNTVEVGFERITKDGYIEVKVGDFKNTSKNFKLKHRLIWEEIKGPVPEGFQVRFIDGNKKNLEFSNLKLVSLSESLKINSMSDSSILKRFLNIKNQLEVDKIINDFPAIIEVKRNTIKLNQKLKTDERQTSVI